MIVDITLALSKNPHWNTYLGFDETMLTPPDTRETQCPPFCKHHRVYEGCCGSDTIQKDQTIDQERVSEYLRLNTLVTRLFLSTELREEDKILLPYRAYGFVLRSRQWGKQPHQYPVFIMCQANP